MGWRSLVRPKLRLNLTRCVLQPLPDQHPCPAPISSWPFEATALRYAGHPGLRSAGLSVTDWLALYRANIEVESAYRPGSGLQVQVPLALVN